MLTWIVAAWISPVPSELLSVYPTWSLSRVAVTVTWSLMVSSSGPSVNVPETVSGSLLKMVQPSLPFWTPVPVNVPSGLTVTV